MTEERIQPEAAQPNRPARRILFRLLPPALALLLLLGLLAWAHVASRDTPELLAPTVSGSAWPGGGRLFVNSLLLAGTSALIAALLGLAAGVYLGRKPASPFACLALAPLFFPPHLAAYVWRFTLEDLARLIVPTAGLWRTGLTRLLGGGWTLGALLWPIPAFAVALALHLRGNRLEEELSTLAPPGALFRRAVLPALLPALLAGSGVVFLLALADYGIPLMWNIPAQNVAAFARLAAFYEPGRALILSLPLLGTAVIGCGAGLLLMRRHGRSDVIPPRPQSVLRPGLPSGIAFGLVLLLTVAVPLGSLITSRGVLSEVRKSFLAGFEPCGWGMAIAALGASGAVMLAVSLALLCRRRRFLAWPIEFAGLALLFMPATLLCIAAVQLRALSPWVAAVYDSLWIFFIAYALRLFYLPWKLARLAQNTESTEHRDMERLLGLNRLTRLRLALGGMLRPAVFGGWLIVFAFALGEVEIASFLVQPGRQPISVFLDNLMHYGRSTTVIQWALLMLAAEILMAWLLLKTGVPAWRRLRVTT